MPIIGITLRIYRLLALVPTQMEVIHVAQLYPRQQRALRRVQESPPIAGLRRAMDRNRENLSCQNSGHSALPQTIASSGASLSTRRTSRQLSRQHIARVRSTSGHPQAESRFGDVPISFILVPQSKITVDPCADCRFLLTEIIIGPTTTLPLSLSHPLTHWEFPRLCREGNRSLTFPGVCPGYTPGLNSITAGMSSGDVERLKARIQERLPADSDGVPHAPTR